MSVRQDIAIKKTLERIKNRKPVVMKEIMREAGYSEMTVREPSLLTKSKAWQETMKGINWGKQLQQLEDMGDMELNTDKDNVLKAKDMLFKLGDKYPKGETKIVGIFNKIESISNE